jgi:hypothetical protein
LLNNELKYGRPEIIETNSSSENLRREYQFRFCLKTNEEIEQMVQAEMAKYPVGKIRVTEGTEPAKAFAHVLEGISAKADPARRINAEFNRIYLANPDQGRKNLFYAYAYGEKDPLVQLEARAMVAWANAHGMASEHAHIRQQKEAEAVAKYGPIARTLLPLFENELRDRSTIVDCPSPAFELRKRFQAQFPQKTPEHLEALVQAQLAQDERARY